MQLWLLILSLLGVISISIAVNCSFMQEIHELEYYKNIVREILVSIRVQK